MRSVRTASAAVGGARERPRLRPLKDHVRKPITDSRGSPAAEKGLRSTDYIPNMRSSHASPATEEVPSERKAPPLPVSKPLRILHVISGLGQGGHEMQLFHYIRGTQVECEHRVISLSAGGVYRDRLRNLGIVVKDLRRRGRGDPHRLLRLVTEVRRFRPDIIHGHLFTGNLYGYLATRLAFPVGKRPPLLSARVTSHPKRPAVADRLERTVFRRSRFVVVNAEILREEVCMTYGVSPTRVRYLPNIVDPEALEVSQTRREVRSELGLADGDLAVGHIGSFSPEKRHDLLLEAFADAASREPALRLVLIGGGSRMDEIRRRADELGIPGGRVLWLGWRGDVPRLLRGMDLTVNSSDREGCSNAILESLAMSIPVVATRVGGTPETLGHGDAGVLIPPGDVSALSAALTDLARDEPRRVRLAEAGLRLVWRRHSPDVAFPILLSIYQEASLSQGVVPS